MLAGRQEVGRRGADAGGAERRVREAGEVRIVAAELGVDGLWGSGVQRTLQSAGRVLNLEPRARVRVHVPPRGRAVGHLARDGGVKAGLVPRFIRVRHADPRI